MSTRKLDEGTKTEALSSINNQFEDALVEGPALVYINFKSGASVSYHQDFSIEVNGRLWPRQLRAAHEMIEIYKHCSREDSTQDGGSNANKNLSRTLS